MAAYLSSWLANQREHFSKMWGRPETQPNAHLFPSFPSDDFFQKYIIVAMVDDKIPPLCFFSVLSGQPHLAN